MKRRPPNLHPAMKYAWDVRQNRITTCEWIKLLVKRHFTDLDRERTKAFPFYHDEDEADAAIEFFGMLRHSKGEWAGQPFILEPWQQFILWVLFGWRRESDGMRRFRTCYLEVARKNGKTTLAAGIGLYMLIGDGEAGSEVYAAATKFDQAKICHSEAERMVKSSEDMAADISVHVNNLFVADTNSFFRPLGRDHHSLDGLNTQCAIIDEIHAHKTRDLYDVLETSTGSRRQPLIFGITTAGLNKQTICYELHSYAQKILEGTVDDETFMGVIFTLDQKRTEIIDGKEVKIPADDWQNEKNWLKSNPNLRVSAKIDDLRRKAKKAAEIPSALNTYLRLHLNCWTEAETNWIPADTWAKCSFPVDETQLKGRKCYAGLDLSSNKDISALVLVFPPESNEDTYKILPRFFIPDDNITKRVKNDRVPFDVWVKDGLVTATPGKVINYDFILEQVSQDAQQFDLLEIAFDRWGATKIVQELEAFGFYKPADNKYANRFLIDFGQGYKDMNSPMKELENLILDRRIAHGGNPVLAWMCSNIVATLDPAGNIKPDKAKSVERIDGIVATIMGLARAILQENDGDVPMPTFI